MIGVNTSIGIGVFGGLKASSGNGGGGGDNDRDPEIFTPAQDDTQVVLSSPARKVTVFHNGIKLEQQTVQVPGGTFTHATNTTPINFTFNLNEGDVVEAHPRD